MSFFFRISEKSVLGLLLYGNILTGRDSSRPYMNRVSACLLLVGEINISTAIGTPVSGRDISWYSVAMGGRMVLM